MDDHSAKLPVTHHFYETKDSNVALASQITQKLREKMNHDLLSAWEVADILTALDDLMRKRAEWTLDFLEIGYSFVSSISKDKSGQDAVDFFRIISSIADQPKVVMKFIGLLKGGWWSSDLYHLLEQAKSSMDRTWIRIVPALRRF